MEFSNLKVVHYTDVRNQTGLTVFLFEEALKCGVWLCGSAPGTREVLPFTNSGFIVDQVHALLFTGGSAYGLDAAGGVMEWLRERKQGIAIDSCVVPIVPAACIFDLLLGSAMAPKPIDAYQACRQATSEAPTQGQVGAGTGAQVGKLDRRFTPMSGGFGFAELAGPDALVVRAYVVVNATGDIVNAKGEIIAGAKQQGEFVDSAAILMKGNIQLHSISDGLMNTTLVAIFINSHFGKEALIRIGKMASAGIAQSIRPCFTSFDGDIVFCLASGGEPADEILVGQLSAEAVRLAIVNAVQP